jgi:hypothetical protein
VPVDPHFVRQPGIPVATAILERHHADHLGPAPVRREGGKRVIDLVRGKPAHE